MVPVAKLFSMRITTTEELKEFLKVLQERLEKIIARGDSIILE
jgi:hypothetical protein